VSTLAAAPAVHYGSIVLGLEEFVSRIHAAHQFVQFLVQQLLVGVGESGVLHHALDLGNAGFHCVWGHRLWFLTQTNPF
jgi:hypothetical protein